MTQADQDIYWDPFDPALRDDPHALWKRLRDDAPVYHNDRYGFWALSRYDDVEGAHKDAKTFSSAHGITIEHMSPVAYPESGQFIMLDPPEHTRLRALVSRAFTPRAIVGVEAQAREITNRLLDAVAGRDSFDYVQEFGAILPPTVISSLIGVPEADQEELRKQVDLIFHLEDEVGMFNPTALAAMGALHEYLSGQLEERRTSPRDDMLTRLVEAEITDESGTHKLRLDQATDFGLMIFIAGTETVARLLGWAASVLAEHPDQRAELRDDPTLIPNAVEELLRYEAPSPVQGRWTTADVEVHGRTIPQDSKIVLLTGAANRDERRFADPDRFDIHRHMDHHVALGYGIHFCLGAALARMEGRIAIEETLKRYPTWEVDRDNAEMLYTSTVRGYAKLPISV
ncbi:MAG: cytochrome [Acidimicrobiales bacterium]|jgi:cytochrome P450|nr:cytochrome [Acidimicrobiales bacterium]